MVAAHLLEARLDAHELAACEVEDSTSSAHARC